MNRFLFFIAFLSWQIALSQHVSPSNTYVRTCINNVECSSINSVSYIFFDEARGRFYLRLNFNDLKTGVDSLDFWIEDLTESMLYFVASLSREEFPNSSVYSVRNIRLNGQLFLNNQWRPHVIDASLYRADKDMGLATHNNTRVADYKINFSFDFSPKEFNIHKKPHRLTNNIFIGVGGGQINPLKGGMENEVGEAYNRD